MRNPMMRCLSLLLMAGLLAACSTPKVLTINERQTLVMDAPLLSAGVIADAPSLGLENGKRRASSVLSNDAQQPVTVHYRFYWYDGNGLDILPYDDVQTLVLPPQTEITISSARSNPDVRQIRLHLFL
ncbi:YcfL family protein [Brenneria izbisi]|uniref:YcfL family protein n=1 Tax=Brenneria izbisi TaxID=2939450 RepID=A0AA41XVE8_9GAMM|nr:YcfL family protein [Brenneria izbisi]MCV9877708.1 YcfL family protein [Brenneria izbisi]MCV9880727.1 YcfL family protein [Brenneria izbisi]